MKDGSNVNFVYLMFFLQLLLSFPDGISRSTKVSNVATRAANDPSV